MKPSDNTGTLKPLNGALGGCNYAILTDGNGVQGIEGEDSRENPSQLGGGGGSRAAAQKYVWRTEALVTYNVTDFAEAAEHFRISVFTPAEVLKKVKP